jgi:DNA (cytosine-5)-methyltransferase 1
MNKTSAFKLGSLFSGAGGLDLGFLTTGKFDIEFAVELLEAPSRTYASNFRIPAYSVLRFPNGKAIYIGDIRKINFSRYTGPNLDVLIGGPPCQDFSILRGPDWNRQGILADRGRLYLHFLRSILTLKPKIFVFENVPGLVNANRGLAYQFIINGFRQTGWKIIFNNIVDSSLLGVPQKRKRLIVIGLRKDLSNNIDPRKTHEILEHYLNNRNSLLAKYPLTPLETFEGQPLSVLGDKYREIMSEYSDLIQPKKQWSIVDDYLDINKIIPSNQEEIESAFKEHERLLKEMGWLGKPVYDLNLPDRTTERPNESPNSIERMKHIPPNGNYEMLKGTKWYTGTKRMNFTYRRLHPLKPAYTILASNGGGTSTYHYERNLCGLTHRERARLQTFPDRFLFYGNSVEIRAQIGEAVPPLLSRHIALACIELLESI